MSREHDSVRFGAQWRAALRRRLSRALPGASVRARLDQLAESVSDVEARVKSVAGALHSGPPAADLQPLLEWIRGAEAHLAALQADHAHLRESQRRQVAQLDRMTARAAALEARIADLERLDTEIVLAVARNRAAGSPP